MTSDHEALTSLLARFARGIDLRDWALRSGRGGVRFTGARLLNAAGEETLHFTLGETLTLDFSLEVSRSDFGNPVQLSVLLRASDGQALANITDLDGGFDLTPGTGPRRVQVQLPDLRFYPDRYFLSLWAGSDYGDQTYDLVEDALSFEITGGGELTPRRLSRQSGLVFLDSRWSAGA